VAMDRMIEKGIKVDAIICDPPYGTTKNRWDIVIPLDEMWNRLNSLIKDNGAIVLFSDGLFTSKLKLSNENMWRYDIVWDKVLTSGFLNANRMPLRSHEIVSVFYKKLPIYNPQKVLGKKNHGKGKSKVTQNNNYGEFDFVDNADILGEMKHPNQLEYLRSHIQANVSTQPKNQ
jgi:site-specific DNA-methyltransferase (adenine-specific)